MIMWLVVVNNASQWLAMVNDRCHNEGSEDEEWNSKLLAGELSRVLNPTL